MVALADASHEQTAYGWATENGSSHYGVLLILYFSRRRQKRNAAPMEHEADVMSRLFRFKLVAARCAETQVAVRWHGPAPEPHRDTARGRRRRCR